ncbi:thioredoxin domain-containing protein [Patescibacteria group bacterium]|nr:thioredoxin domain-containing protein [Patescibacteria group bacterium]HOC96494.1 thioredoxin domain-containing protein [bacterium]
MKKGLSLLIIIPLVIVFIYLIIFFFVFFKNDKKLVIEENNVVVQSYGYASNNDNSSKYSSIFSPKFGNSDAKIKVVLFFDFDCPYCAQEFDIFYNTMEKYYAKGYFEFRNFPLESIHPNSRKLASAGMCANEQGKFLEMFKEIYSDFAERDSGNNDTDGLIARYINNIGLDEAKFNKCMQDARYDKIINKDIIDGLNYGVEGTPTFFINGYKYAGVMQEEDWDNIFKSIK